MNESLVYLYYQVKEHKIIKALKKQYTKVS